MFAAGGKTNSSLNLDTFSQGVRFCRLRVRNEALNFPFLSSTSDFSASPAEVIQEFGQESPGMKKKMSYLLTMFLTPRPTLEFRTVAHGTVLIITISAKNE